MKILFWRVLVEPVKPKDMSDGGIALPPEAIQAQEANTMVAKIVDMGSFAFTARTSLGYNYAEEPNKPKIGDYVVIPKYGSRDIQMSDKRKLRLVEDFEILAVTDNPKELLSYV